MTRLVPKDDIRRLQRRMNRLMEDVGIPEEKYMPEIRRIQEKMNRLVEDFMEEGGPLQPMKISDIMKPLADIKETDEEVLVTMDIPGMNKGDIELSVSEESLEVKAERKSEKEVKEEDFYKKERVYSKFERVIKLPAEVKPDETKATLKDGVLEVCLPKVEVTSRKKIAIE